MQVYDFPTDDLPPVPNLEPKKPVRDYLKKIEAHQEMLKQHLINLGYTGTDTGKIYRTPKADGYACYMFADAPGASCLVHLPYVDGWHEPDVEFVPEEVIRQRINRRTA